MREVADLILSFPDETPVVVLSAMGKTTNNLLLAGENAVSCGAPKASEIPKLAVIKDLHLRTVDELGLDKSIVSGILLFAPLCSWNASAVSHTTVPHAHSPSQSCDRVASILGCSPHHI
eukprot:XP_020396053.1 uncharacterized LOC100279708 isoform X1 [Zea mays]